MPELRQPLADELRSGAPSVSLVDPLGDEQWDAQLAAFPNASFFHGGAWARTLRDAYGYKPVYFIARENGRLSAVLPMMEVDSWLTGRRGVSLPFTDECTPLCRDEGLFKQVREAVLDHARSRKWKYMEIRGGIGLFGDAPSSTSFLGHLLDLQGSEAELSSRLAGSVRRAIRKAEESGLSLEISEELEAVRVFHRLLCKTRKRHGTPPQPFDFFESIHRHILAKKKGLVILARQNGVPVAGAVYFHFGKTVIYKYGASDEAFQHLRANNLVMWAAIKRYASDGFHTLDFGRTSLANEGLRKFKLGWGTSEKRIDYVRYDLRAKGFKAPGNTSSGWHEKLFKLLPQPVFNLVGALLYKHVA